MNRRKFLELMGTRLGLTTLVGCSKDKDHRVPQKPRVPESPAYEAQGIGKYVTFSSGLELEIVEDRNLTKKGKEFYDPNYSGNPLLRVTEDDLEKLISKNFTLKEFAVMKDPSLMLKHRTQNEQKWKRGELDMGHDGERYWRFIRLSPKLIDLLQEAREKGGPMNINSGLRSYLYNKASYRKMGQRIVSTSPHISGIASDVSVFITKARDTLRHAFRGRSIGFANSYIHVDLREDVRRWTYGGYRKIENMIDWKDLTRHDVKPTTSFIEEEKGFKCRGKYRGRRYRGHERTKLVDRTGKVFKEVCTRFYRSLLMEGSGLLEDGQRLTYDTRKNKRYRFKKSRCKDSDGAGGCLAPFYTIAADTSTRTKNHWNFGDVIYMPQIDGEELLDGSLHNGFLVVRDTGDAFAGRNHLDLIDIFSGKKDQRVFFTSRGINHKHVVRAYKVKGNTKKRVLNHMRKTYGGDW